MILGTPDLDERVENYLRELASFTSILNEWDKFNHANAWEGLKTQKMFIAEFYTSQLLNVINARRCFDERKKIPASNDFTRYESIVDLIYNAKRKASQKKYDDATARIYRATELLAQTRLMLEYGINTSNVDVLKITSEENRLKFGSRFKIPSEKIQIGLFESYWLLNEMEDEVFSTVFSKCEDKMKSALEVRNNSILAHGSKSVSSEDYTKVYSKLVEDIIMPILHNISPELWSKNKQLPKDFSDTEF